ncbi:MAG: YIP1 family protein [Deltaproteobacteria bacterium]|nr:YIP1 family protein [Candidatus Zymogenaceae bacterium]
MDVIERVRGLVTGPEALFETLRESDRLEQETLIFVCIAALIPFFASLFGQSIVGYGIGQWGRFRLPFGYALLSGILRYFLTVGMVFAGGCIIMYIAPKFDATADYGKALLCASYGYLPFFLGGIFLFIPAASILTFITALGGIYILYLSLPIVTGNPEERTAVYTLTGSLALALLLIIVMMIVARINYVFMVTSMDKLFL